MDSPMLVTWML